jgi:hypothetical protein
MLIGIPGMEAVFHRGEKVTLDNPEQVGLPLEVEDTDCRHRGCPCARREKYYDCITN